MEALLDTSDDQLLSDKEAAALLGLGVQTIRDWRSNGRVDLPFIKFGNGAVRYRLGDLREFCARNRQTTTS